MFISKLQRFFDFTTSIHSERACFPEKFMFQGKSVSSQIVPIVSKYESNKSVEKYRGNHRAKDLGCWPHFLYMMFGQLAHREGVRDIITCPAAHKSKVYHLGPKKVVAHTPPARANENRDWRIWAGFARYPIKAVRPLYPGGSGLTLGLDNTVYALGPPAIGPCPSVFRWAGSPKEKSGGKTPYIDGPEGQHPCIY